MTETETPFGCVKTGTTEELFAAVVALAAGRFDASTGRPFLWALSGGSTPQAWYRWCAAGNAIPPALAAAAHFTVSDERSVSLGNPESNFGNAARLLLDPLRVPPGRRLPWPVNLEPASAAARYAEEVARLAGAGRAYDACLLGVGDDAHTASLFPGSPLLADDGGRLFAAVAVPGKGWRLTVTPAGLRACGLIVVLATGSGKTAALRRIFRGPIDPASTPAQILQTCADRVVWLLDAPAAAGIG
jgi:6-phosphogluconolactonase